MTSSVARRLDCSKAAALCQRIFKTIGLAEDAAQTVSDSLIFADMRGISTHGITRVKMYCDRARSGIYNVSPDLKLINETDGAFLLDADNAFGAVAGTKAMELAIAKAGKTGTGFGSVAHSSHFGAASFYSMMAASKGMIGFCCTNGPANMAPFGSREPMLGTNPFSVAVPTASFGPVVLDIATSVVARGNILNAAKDGKPIPEDWAIDQDGNSTTDPAAALKGAILPFGGHKGSGIAIMINVLSSILSGSQDGSKIGHSFLAIDIKALQDLNQFESSMDTMIEELKSAKKAQGVKEILYPGELEARRCEESKRSGIPISEGVYKELSDVCSSMNLLQELEAAQT